MKNVYLVQPSEAKSVPFSTVIKSIYLPYAAGELAAYAWQFPEVRDHYDFKGFLFEKNNVTETAASLEEPFLVGFSCYIWNISYNLSLAAAIKARWPNCLTLFGGPQIPEDGSYLQKYKQIDFQLTGEGEVNFYRFLVRLNKGESLEEIGNIAFRRNGGLVFGPKELGGDIADFPSPYTDEMFGRIVRDPRYAHYQFDAVIETNRGCPYRCAYCSWGKNTSAVRCFPLERVIGDLDWFAANKIAYLYCADANFGIFPRDGEIVDHMIALKKKCGYPERFITNVVKNKDDFVFDLYCKLTEAKMHWGAPLSCQSMTPEVLKIIGRNRISNENLAKQLKAYDAAGIPAYVELILALPGETFESFCKSLAAVFEAGCHYLINLYPCELLPIAPMAEPSFVEKYQIKTVKAKLFQAKEMATDDDEEEIGSEIVVETSTMSRADWCRAYRFAACALAFHCFGLTRYIAAYLRKAQICSYYEFYSSLFDWINTESTFIKETLDYVTRSVDEFSRGEGPMQFFDTRFSDYNWWYQEGIFLVSTLDSDRFYAEIRAFVSRFLPDGEMKDELFTYQKSVMALPDKKTEEHTFTYDWQAFFADIMSPDHIELPKRNNTLRFVQREYRDLRDYANEVGRRGRPNVTCVPKIEEVTA